MIYVDSYVDAFKKKRRSKVSNSNEEVKYDWKNLVSRILLSMIFFLVSVIFVNQSDDNLLMYQDYVYTDSWPFTKIKKAYENLFGDVVSDVGGANVAVFSGKLMYKSIEDYLDGEKLVVDSNSIISNVTSGIVVYIGEKEGYGNTVIVQGIDGVDVWYGNLSNVAVSLYDYLEADTILGEVNGNELYLVIKKGNEFIKYEDYQS